MKNKPKKAITQNNICRTKYLSDDPSEVDAFGGHNRIANALYDTILNEDGDKSVAITGSWGSGKSTIIKILSNIIKNGKKNIYMFCYDAWMHQNDPLRRSFLEELLYFLKSKKLLNEKFVKEKKEILTGEKEISHSTTTPILTLQGKIFAVLVVIIPLGYALFNYSDLSKTLKLIPIISLPVWLISLIIVAFPILATLITTIILEFIKFDKKRDIFQIKEINKIWNESFKFISKKIREETITETIKTPNPTSIEFLEIFNESLRISFENSIKQNKDSKFIVVIDNLDRLEADEALDVWSTMKSFFEGKKHNVWENSFWLVVPFDQEGIKELWKDQKGKSSQAFIDKTFQIKFTVTQPILSDWKNYFKENAKIVFPDHGIEEINHIYEIYWRYKRVNNGITPRDIVLYLNSIGTYHRLWCPIIPISIIALYVIFIENVKEKSDAINLIKQLNEEDIIKTINEKYWQNFIASLHHNIEPEKSIQVLIGPRILKALTSLDIDELKEISKFNNFLEICEQTIKEQADNWTSINPNNITNSAIALDSLDLKISYTSSSIPIIWNILSKFLKGIKRWNQLNKSVGVGIIKILEKQKSSSYHDIAEHSLNILVNNINFENIEAKDWAACTFVIIDEFVIRNNYENLVSNNFDVPGPADFYIDVIFYLITNEADNRIIKFYTPLADKNEIIQKISSDCSEDLFDEKYVELINKLVFIEKSWDWEEEWQWNELGSAIQQKLQFNSNTELNYIRYCLRIILSLKYFNESTVSNTVLQNLSGQGHIFHHIITAKKSDEYEILALLMLSIIEFNPACNMPQPIGQSNNGLTLFNSIINDPQNNQEIVEPFLEIIIYYKNFKRLFEIAVGNSKYQSFILNVIEKIITTGDITCYFDSSYVFDKYVNIEKILSNYSEDLSDNFISIYASNNDMIQLIISNDFNIDKKDLYIKSLELVNKKNRKELKNFFVQKFKSMSKDEWFEELKKEGDILDILFALLYQKESLNLETNFYEALQDYSKEVIIGNNLPEYYIDDWNILLKALKQNLKNSMIKNIIGELIYNPDARLSLAIKLYPDEIYNSQDLIKKADDIVIQLFIRIIDNRNLDDLNIMDELIRNKPEIIENSDKDSLDTINDKIISQLEIENDENIIEILKIFRKNLYKYLI